MSFVGIFCFFVTNNERRPKWYSLIVWYSFVVTVVWLDIIANECVAVAETLGFSLHISSAILGLTVLAWGDSVGDLVADTAVAKSGKPTAAVAACFGAPLLTNVLGLGLSLGVYTVKSGDLKVKVKSLIYLSWMFLGFTMIISMIAFSKNGFRGPKWL